MSEKMRLFHLSNHFKKDITDFIPRVPDSRMGKEDGTIKRICVAPTIEDCIKAHPDILLYMNSWDICQRATVEESMAHRHVLLEHGLSGFLCKLYVFEVDKDIVISNQELQSRKLVPDANVTNEHWIIDTVQPIHSEYILINTANVEYCIETGDVIQEEIYFYSFKNENIRGEVMCELHYSSHTDFIENTLNHNDAWNAVLSKEEVNEFSTYLKNYFKLIDDNFRNRSYFNETEDIAF